MSSLKLISILKEANARVSAVKSFIDKVSDAAALEKANLPLFNAFKEVLAFSKTDANQIRGVKVGTQNKNNILTTVDELMYALKTADGMLPETVGLLNQGLLKAKSTPVNMVDDIAKDVVAQENFIRRYGQKTPGDFKRSLEAAGYSPNAVNKLIEHANKNPAFKKQIAKGIAKRRTASGKEKNMKPKTDGSTVPPQQKTTLMSKARELMDMVKVKKMTWKEVLAWGAAIGVGALALWWFLYDSDTVPDDLPEDEPTDTGEWAPCIQELLNSGEGYINTTPGGLVRVIVKTEQYVDGLAFYTNGRVANLTTAEMGKWRCKQGQITIQEQSDTLSTDIEAVRKELSSGALVNSDEQFIINTLKKYKTKQDFQNFLNQYKTTTGRDFGRDLTNAVTVLSDKAEIADLKSHLSSIGMTVDFKNDGKTGEFYAEFGGLDSTSGGSTSEKVGLSNIEITWDTPKRSDGGGGGSTSKYHDCNSKSLPHEFGCRSEQIKRLQICLGLPQKYQTGNFGPITKNAIEEKGVDASNGITQNVIDKICGGEGTTPLNREPIQPITADRLKMSDLTMPKVDIKLPDIKPLEVSDEVFYNALRDNGNLIGEDGNNRIKYKGPDLDEVQLGKLDNVILPMGYTRIKNLEELKPYGSKYVWKKIR